MSSKLPANLKTYLAWRFDSVLPGTFRRNKSDFAHHEYPILAPLPTAGRNTPTAQRAASAGPYLYFVCDEDEVVRYVGKSMEKHVIQRWVRPGVGGPAKHYWTHSTRSGGCVFNIARGLQGGESKFYTLRFIPVSEIGHEQRQLLGVPVGDDLAGMAELAEKAMIRTLRPDWNAY